MPGVCAAVDVVVVPTIVQEAFSLAAAEGLAMGKPVVASAVGGMLEFVNSGNGVLVPPGDADALYWALQRLMDDHVGRGRLAAAARESIEAYTWQKAASQLDVLYRDLLARKPDIVLAKPPAFFRV